MNAIELAEKLHIEWRDDGLNYDTALEASFMLRDQHEAIVKLREALIGSLWRMNEYGYQAMEGTIDRAEQALKETEDLK